MSLLLRDIAYYICSCSCSYSSSAVVVVAVVVVIVVYLSAYLYLYICLSVYLQAWKGSYSARLPQRFNLTTLWQRQQRNSSRLPECFNLTVSKTKLFCETSSIFEVDNIENEAILRDVLQKWKVACRADGLVPMRFAIFPLHLCKVLRLPRKSDARSYEVLHRSRKIILANLQIWCSKIQPLSGSQRPDLLTPLMNSCTAPAMRNASLQILCKCPTPAIVFGNATKRSRFAHFWQGAESLAPATQTASGPSKVVLACRVFNILTWKCASRATTACTCSTSQLPKVLRTWCTLYILTSKCASRHNGVQYFISHLARCLRTRHFSEPTFRPSGATNPSKNTQWFATLVPFRAPHLLSSDSFSSLIFSLLLFSSLTLPTSAFPSVHVVGSLTSKLLSIIAIPWWV